MNLLQLSVTVQWFVGDLFTKGECFRFAQVSTSLEMTCLDA